MKEKKQTDRCSCKECQAARKGRDILTIHDKRNLDSQAAGGPIGFHIDDKNDDWTPPVFIDRTADTKEKQRTIEERWAADNKLPNFGVGVTPPTEESIELARQIREWRKANRTTDDE
ncbi:hypothetical protein [Neobacillus sp. CF12]|uniref:hypothetical protein n=1 Tax=Neobacillus sp. CF12 TaxID=3055864 RepID=UPI0025A13E35|nr:hypothetical protein [Neobacillus sp. CF12]MDM5326816.1 hypothetical protein [Neobacillus sp. CF12]